MRLVKIGVVEGVHGINDNNTKLFSLIVDVVTCKCEGRILICTKDDNMLANS